MGLLAAAALGVGSAGYFRLVYYERVAARHLPQDAAFAARVDVEQGVLFEPVRKHLFPLVAEIFGAAPDSAEEAELLRTIERETGLERRELRELLVARGTAWRDWHVVVAGRFPKTGAIAGLGRIIDSRSAQGWRRVGENRLVHEPLGVALGQAEDGSLIIAASETRLRAALPSTGVHEQLGLGSKGPGAFAANRSLLAELAAEVPATRRLASSRRVYGQLRLGDPLYGDVFFEPPLGSTPANWRPEIEGGLSELRAYFATLPRRDVAGERATLERARVSATGSEGVQVSFAWQRDELDRGAALVASGVRKWLANAKRH
jgi:hypothetical protein